VSYICEGCGKQIFRNLAWLNSRSWHFGELKEAGFFGARFICESCGNYLTKLEITESDASHFCGICGSQWLRRINGQPAEATEVLM
jgi:predicted RNA-binding Zn-ribbon protein involved in translation (DUF1610 family)